MVALRIAVFIHGKCFIYYQLEEHGIAEELGFYIPEVWYLNIHFIFPTVCYLKNPSLVISFKSILDKSYFFMSLFIKICFLPFLVNSTP